MGDSNRHPLKTDVILLKFLTMEEEEEKPKKKKKKQKVKKADKIKNLTLSLGEAMRLIMQEEMKKKKQAKDEHIRKLAMEQKAKRAAASGHDVVRQGVLIHI